MHEPDVHELQLVDVGQRYRRNWLRVLRRLQNRLEIRERDFGLTIDVDDVPQLLHRAEDEEGVEQQREELANRDFLGEDQIEHHEQDARTQEIHCCPLYETQTSYVLHLLELQPQGLFRRRIEAHDFLIGEPEAFNQLDISQRFGRRSGQCSRLGDDHLLDVLDAATQRPAQRAEQRHGSKKRRHDHPVNGEGVDHHEHYAHQRRENQIDRERDEALDVLPYLLQFAQRLAASLILEHGVGQLQRVPDSLRVHLGPDALDDHVDVIVLEVLGNARHERHAHRHQQQGSRALDESRRLILAESRRVVVDHVTENQRIEQRKDLIRRGQHQREKNQLSVFMEIRIKDGHNGLYAGVVSPANAKLALTRCGR